MKMILKIKFHSQEEFKKSETVYRALGKQQNNINEILFNAEEVAEQKKKTQQVMMNGLQVEIDKLEEEANRFENEMKDADNYIEEIGNDASEMGKILEKIKYQRQADRIMKKIDTAVDLNEDDMDEVKAEDLYRDLTTAEINEKLEKMYEKNQQLYDQVNDIMSELQNEGFNFDNEDNNLNNESLRDSVYMENYQKLIELKKQHKKVGNTLNKNKQTIHTIKYPKFQNNSKKNSKKQSKQKGQKRVFNPDNLTKSKDVVAPKPIYTTSIFQQFNNEDFQNQQKSTVQPKNNQNFPQFPQQTNKPNNQSDVYSYHQQIKEYEIKKGGENIFNNDFTQQPENYQNFQFNLPQQQESVKVIKKEQNQDLKSQLQKCEVQVQQIKSLTPQQREVVNWVKSQLQQSNIEVDCQECKNQSKEYFQCQKCQNKRKIFLDPKLSDTIISNQILSHLPFFEKQYEENKESNLKKENNVQLLKQETKIKEKKEENENDTVKPENSFINLQSKTPNVNQDYVISSESQKFLKKFECSSCFNEIKDAKIKYVCQTCNENKQICEQCENISNTCGHGLVKLKPEHENQLNHVQQNKSSDNKNQDKKQELKYFSQFYPQTQVTKEPNEEKIHKLMKDEEQKIQQQQKSSNNENISEDVKELGSLLGSQILLNSQNSVDTSQKSRKTNSELMAKIELDSEIEQLQQSEKFYPILQLTNTGGITWENVYLRCIEGTYTGGQQQISQKITPGSKTTVCLSLIAPKKAKEHVSFWRLYKLDKQKEKQFFGPRFQLTITVAKQNSTTSSQQLSQITPGQDGLQFSTNYQNN
ncbi:hypothetical protein PPERSA_08582 [Pseudocohnilembus persalinus]|uniref:Nbr1 FW domain-containing protein n=1 Tax=Pseudocohnilembus persalinus TaxID=266149 RepID=A0A0V0R6T3_PSEPJ|nr:hypothetical protein PPERSA_08582 [Pseudocohnilembus persalinus]|eukprot:KRX10179.1 hypothetical protein PPERSA_08582 [Pseudocohnilembus persalinus]